MYGINCIVFRVANPYGPRSQMKHSKYSIINWFLRQLMENRRINIFGDGSQIRDYIYVYDLACAFIAASVNEKCYGHAFNVGSGKGTTFAEMVATIMEVVGSGKIEYVPWPEDYVNVETGDYITDIRKVCSFTDWQPVTDLKTGVEHTFEYYQTHKSHYW